MPQDPIESGPLYTILMMLCTAVPAARKYCLPKLEGYGWRLPATHEFIYEVNPDTGKYEIVGIREKSAD